MIAKQDPSKPETVCPTSIDEYALDEMVKDFTEATQEETSGVAPLPDARAVAAGPNSYPS